MPGVTKVLVESSLGFAEIELLEEDIHDSWPAYMACRSTEKLGVIFWALRLQHTDWLILAVRRQSAELGVFECKFVGSKSLSTLEISGPQEMRGIPEA